MNLDVVFSGNSACLEVDFSGNSMDLDVGFGAFTVVSGSIGEDDIYQGPYAVTPTVGGRSLPTAQMYLEQDVTIRAIPYYDVANPAGGNTIYIADEV